MRHPTECSSENYTAQNKSYELKRRVTLHSKTVVFTATQWKAIRSMNYEITSNTFVDLAIIIENTIWTV
jgi:hypothetical protein